MTTLGHRVATVEHEVEQHLLELAGIDRDAGVPLEPGLDGHGRPGETTEHRYESGTSRDRIDGLRLQLRWIPKSIARRGKVIFRAPLDSFHMDPEPPFVAQLLSEDSLRRTGYFDLKEVTRWRKGFRELRPHSLPRLSVEMGLTAVVATQLWHHQFMGGGLADLPEWSGYAKVFANSVVPSRTISAFATSAVRSLSSPGHRGLC